MSEFTQYDDQLHRPRDLPRATRNNMIDLQIVHSLFRPPSLFRRRRSPTSHRQTSLSSDRRPLKGRHCRCEPFVEILSRLVSCGKERVKVGVVGEGVEGERREVDAMERKKGGFDPRDDGRDRRVDVGVQSKLEDLKDAEEGEGGGEGEGGEGDGPSLRDGKGEARDEVMRMVQTVKRSQRAVSELESADTTHDSRAATVSGERTPPSALSRSTSAHRWRR